MRLCRVRRLHRNRHNLRSTRHSPAKPSNSPARSVMRRTWCRSPKCATRSAPNLLWWQSHAASRRAASGTLPRRADRARAPGRGGSPRQLPRHHDPTEWQRLHHNHARRIAERPQRDCSTNGYTGQVTQSLRRRVIPVTSYMIATAPLSPNLMATLMPKGRMLSDSNRLLCYFRPSPDNTRVLFGGRPAYTDI